MALDMCGMQPPGFGGKPSPSHVLWRPDGGGPVRFDESRVRQWCQAHGVDYETDERVDHERGDVPRTQRRLVFAWEESASESFSMGEDDWTLTTGRTPRTFVEIDETGTARVRGWDATHILVLTAVWTEGAALRLRARNEPETLSLPAERLAERQ